MISAAQITQGLLAIVKDASVFLPEPAASVVGLLDEEAEVIAAALFARQNAVPSSALLAAIDAALKAQSDAQMKTELGP